MVDYENLQERTMKEAFARFTHKVRYALYGLYIKIFPKKGKKVRPGGVKRSMAIFAWAVMSVQVVLFAVFYVYKNFSAIALAFKDPATNAFTLGNFKYVFSEIVSSSGGSTLFIAFRNTAIFFVLGLALMVPNIIISCVLYKRIWGYKIFQVIFFFPTIIGSMVWAAAYKNFIAPNGPMFSLLMKMHWVSEVPEILADSRYALQGVMGMSIWLGLPSNMLLYCGSLARVPKEVIEAGKLDGITFFKEVRHLLIPLIWPLISTNIIFAFIGFFNSSGNVLLLTQGKYNTTTFSYWIYEQVVIGDRYNVPSALGLIMTVLTLPFALIGHKLAGLVETVEF